MFCFSTVQVTNRSESTPLRSTSAHGISPAHQAMPKVPPLSVQPSSHPILHSLPRPLIRSSYKNRTNIATQNQNHPIANKMGRNVTTAKLATLGISIKPTNNNAGKVVSVTQNNEVQNYSRKPDISVTEQFINVNTSLNLQKSQPPIKSTDGSDISRDTVDLSNHSRDNKTHHETRVADVTETNEQLNEEQPFSGKINFHLAAIC